MRHAAILRHRNLDQALAPKSYLVFHLQIPHVAPAPFMNPYTFLLTELAIALAKLQGWRILLHSLKTDQLLPNFEDDYSTVVRRRAVLRRVAFGVL